MTDTDEIWKVPELAAYLGIAVSTVRSYVTKYPERLPPRISEHGHARWRKSAVLEWARKAGKEEGKVKAATGRENAARPR